MNTICFSASDLYKNKNRNIKYESLCEVLNRGLFCRNKNKGWKYIKVNLFGMYRQNSSWGVEHPIFTRFIPLWGVEQLSDFYRTKTQNETTFVSVARDSFSSFGPSGKNGRGRNAPFRRITPSLKEVLATLYNRIRWVPSC